MARKEENTINFILRNWIPSDAGAIAELNNSEIPQVSALSSDALIRLAKQFVYFKIFESPEGKIAGFLIALNESAIYDSLNFQWFRAHYPRFTYIDRIVISVEARRKGLGKLFYEDVQTFASGRSPILACEVNLDPPNASSMGFHRHHGFSEVGIQKTEGGKKTVSLLVKNLPVEN